MISLNVAAEMSRLSPTRPLSSMKRIHLDMSRTLDQTEPAAATPSVLRIGTARSVSRTSACGTATFGLPASPDTRGRVSVIPRGVKMRFCTNVAQGMPDTRSTMKPPIAYTTF